MDLFRTFLPPLRGIWCGILLAIAPLSAQASPPMPESLNFEGPDSITIDLIRAAKDGPRIYVQARLPSGELGLFLVDTGADVNVLSEETAEALGLELEEGFYRLSGLSGTTSASRGTVDTLGLGEATLTDVTFAVGVRGVSTTAGYMPLDGILGMDVWKRFIMEIDYPADKLILHRPGTKRLPRRAVPVAFDGSSITAAIEVETKGESPVIDIVQLQVDTGASALLLAGPSGAGFDPASTLGLEPVYGVGASEFLPPSEFLKLTKRIPIRRVRLGGRSFKVNINAQWLYWRPGQRRFVATPGLIGHELLKGSRVFLDPNGERMALTRSRRKRKLVDGHSVLLRQDIERHGEDDQSRDLYRAKLNAALGEWEHAVELLTRYAEAHTDDLEGQVMLARARRIDADLSGAWAALERLSAEDLVAQSEIIAAVNGLALESRRSDAVQLAREATRSAPQEAEAYVALADALLLSGDKSGAQSALQTASVLVQNPDAFLLRRARVAIANGDRFGAMALVRQQIQLYPTEGKFIWYYALLAQSPAEAETVRQDIERAMARLHPELRPLDFMVGAHTVLGDNASAKAYLKQGLKRDCEPMKGDKASFDNCSAWYHGLAGERLDHALDLVDTALEKSGDRPDFLDTKAVIHLARGEIKEAIDAAIAAARLAPDDVYMLWQAERMTLMSAPTDG